MNEASADLHPWFIGAQAENHELFEQLLLESIRDHIYWRRNFHPDDPPPISSHTPDTPEYRDFVARLRQELFSLSASLKHSVPLFSPRYMGHMLSDPVIPGLLAEMLTLPYNPNNVSEEAAPVTVDLEIEVGLQLARMLGMPADPTATPCAFGYLTAGGTLANYQALHVLRAVRFFPLALQAGMRRAGLFLPPSSPLNKVVMDDPVHLANYSVKEAIELHETWQAFLATKAPPLQRKTLADAVHDARLETLGQHDFFTMHRGACSPPVILVPETAHYSWTKAARLLGIGESSLIRIAMRGMRLDPAALEHCLEAAHKTGQTVLCVVGVLGTTEYGTIDPVHELIAARERWHRRGLSFSVHVDAAWGGYLAALFRDEDGAILPRKAVSRHFRYFPSEPVYAAFRDLGQSDSVTVDPHKLGYLPYGTGGAYVCRDHRCMDFVAHDAPYLGRAARNRPDEPAYRRKFRHLGNYILEGSKPGAAAAAAYVTHRVLPLDSEHFGKLLRHGVQSTEYFYDRIKALRERVSKYARVCIPIEPDSNLMCLAFNPAGNNQLASANAYTATVYEHLRIDRRVPLQTRSFFSSSTVLYKRMLHEQDMARILFDLGIAPHTFSEHPEASAGEADGLLVLRHTLMNPWLRDNVNHIDYIEEYCLYLEKLLCDTVAVGSHDHSGPHTLRRS